MAAKVSAGPRAWLIRAGRNGERDQFVLDTGLAAPGFSEVAEISSATTRDKVAALVKAAFPDATEGRINNFTGQLWALRSRIAPGDLIVLPLKTTTQIAIGCATGKYEYRQQYRGLDAVRVRGPGKMLANSRGPTFQSLAGELVALARDQD
jgi:predicted Mrr-cat superfamily restriction endonuclease